MGGGGGDGLEVGDGVLKLEMGGGGDAEGGRCCLITGLLLLLLAVVVSGSKPGFLNTSSLTSLKI